MEYSRRNFMKAAGASAVAVTTTTVASVVPGVEPAAAAPKPSPLAIPEPMTKETGVFQINGKAYKADYEARTTLWEVIAVKLGLTGTNRSCNRASCGACSVLVDGVPFYSCHTLATEGVGKNYSRSKDWVTPIICIPCSVWRTCTRPRNAGFAHRVGK